MGRREHANSPASMPPADVEELPSKQTSSPSAEAAAQTDDLPSGHSLPSGHNALPSGHSLPSGHNALPSGHNAVDAGPLLIDLLEVKEEEVEECFHTLVDHNEVAWSLYKELSVSLWHGKYGTQYFSSEAFLSLILPDSHNRRCVQLTVANTCWIAAFKFLK